MVKVELNNKFRNYIEELKVVWNVSKGTEYIVERMKEIGINNNNYEMMEETMEDIIRTMWSKKISIYN